MKLFAPKYYKAFRCIADKCSHSCCIGWEIDVDGDTLSIYEGLGEGYGDVIKQSIDGEDTPHFRLGENERCPHLDECGLCRIITELGEEYLCDICREHPRFYNLTPNGCEAGLGMACEEVCRIIFSEENYWDTVEIGEVDRDDSFEGLNTLPLREYLYSILSDAKVSYAKRLENIYTAFEISPHFMSDGEWREVLHSLEYLDESHRDMLCGYSSDVTSSGEDEIKLERFLAYLIYRHCTEAYDTEEFIYSLGFCLFCERLFAFLLCKNGADAVTFARIISEELEYSEDNTYEIKSCFMQKR